MVCIKTCYSFKPAKPFQWPKTQVPRSWRSEIALINASGHIDQKLLISREYFWAIFFFWTIMMRATSNQKPTFSKRPSYEKRCFKLEGHLRHATLLGVDHSKKNEWIKEKEKLIVMSCTWKVRLSLNENQESKKKCVEKMMKKCVNTNYFSPARRRYSV